jgi:antirestriction protein ArdC
MISTISNGVKFQKGAGLSGYVAEIGAAFLCADLSITLEPRPDHAAYLASWVNVLKGDRRAIFTAAALAQKAVDWLIDKAGHI